MSSFKYFQQGPETSCHHSNTFNKNQSLHVIIQILSTRISQVTIQILSTRTRVVSLFKHIQQEPETSCHHSNTFNKNQRLHVIIQILSTRTRVFMSSFKYFQQGPETSCHHSNTFNKNQRLHVMYHSLTHLTSTRDIMSTSSLETHSNNELESCDHAVHNISRKSPQ